MAFPQALRLGIVLLCCSRIAWAKDPQLPFEVRSDGSAECSAATFASKLERQSQRLRSALPGERPALDFELNIERKLDELSARIRVHELDGSVTNRTVEGASCDEVLSALALIAVVLVDSSAVGDPRESNPPSTQAAAPRAEPSPRSRPARHWRWGAGVNAGLESPVSPDVSAVAALQLEALLGGEGIFGPRLAVAFNRSAGNTVSTPGGNAHFAWTAARVTGCPLRFPSSGKFAVRPCLFIDAGALDVSGEQTYRPSSTRVTWFSLGGLAHAELWPVTRLAVGVDAGLVAPLVRDRFYFDPGDAPSTLRLPRFGVTLRAGLAVYFE